MTTGPAIEIGVGARIGRGDRHDPVRSQNEASPRRFCVRTIPLRVISVPHFDRWKGAGGDRRRGLAHPTGKFSEIFQIPQIFSAETVSICESEDSGFGFRSGATRSQSAFTKAVFGCQSMQQFNSNTQNPDDDAERQAVERLTKVCEQFQIALQASQPARIEDFLKLLPASLRAEALVRLLTIEDRHRWAQGKRLADGEVLARFPDDADRDVVEKWLGQRSTQVFEETKVDSRANRGKRRPEAQEKTYSADDFPNEDFDVFDELGDRKSTRLNSSHSSVSRMPSSA